MSEQNWWKKISQGVLIIIIAAIVSQFAASAVMTFLTKQDVTQLKKEVVELKELTNTKADKVNVENTLKMILKAQENQNKDVREIREYIFNVQPLDFTQSN